MAVTAAAAISLTGFAAGPAQSAPVTPDPGCATATQAPVGDLTVGEAVTGLTVTQGTDPTSGAFTGTVQGVLEDGIAPGVDMILVDLHSTTIDKVGVWSGMSGSPVYDGDGNLVGAVSYSLGYGPSTIAGVTPAGEMGKLVNGSGTPLLRTARTVSVPRTIRARMVRTGVATSSEANQGMTQLRTPYTVSGISNARVAKLSKVLDVNGGHFTAGSGGPTSGEPIPIEAGGNMAASESYGTVTAAGVGTATMVCGNEVVGFGHPMDFTGPSSLSLHGARAVTIQDDPVNSGFKVANLGAPIGTVDKDRNAGIHGVTGAVPTGSVITSTATAPDTNNLPQQGTTHVTESDLVPDLDFTHLLAVQDKALDRVGKGIATADWTIKGTRKSGAPFTFHRADMYADPSDISAATGFTLANDLSAIIDNSGEVVKVTSVNAHTRFRDDYRRYSVARVQARFHGRWFTGSRSTPLPVRSGRLARLRVLLTSREAGSRTVKMTVHVPWHTLGKVGTLRVMGGDVSTEDSEFFFDEGFDVFDQPPAPSSSTFPKVLKDLTSGLRHDQIQATLRFRHVPTDASRPRRSTHRLSDVVGGARTALVYGVR
jgi:hypothetical protein